MVQQGTARLALAASGRSDMRLRLCLSYATHDQTMCMCRMDRHGMAYVAIVPLRRGDNASVAKASHVQAGQASDHNAA